MTDNATLDDAIMREAIHRAMIGGDGNTEKAIKIAIELVREGWKPSPPDPVGAIVEKLMAKHYFVLGESRLALRDAVNHGAEMERARLELWLRWRGYKTGADDVARGDHWKDNG